MADTSEKRKTPRIDIEIDAQYIFDGVSMKATTANISCGGLFLKLNPQQIRKENLTDVSLILHLPNRQKPIETAARVLRREMSAARHGIALRFEDPESDVLLAIEQLIKSKLN